METPSLKQPNRTTAASDDTFSSIQVNLPPLPEFSPHAWSQVNEKQLRSALIGACKRMPRNAEAHFHLGLMHMRKCEGEEALAAFRHCKRLLQERLEHIRTTSPAQPPRHLLMKIAKLSSHTTQAAYLAAVNQVAREERAPLLNRMQNDLIAATNLDKSQPDIWNALALLHLSEGGSHGARDVLLCARNSFPEYLDALNNLGLSELALSEEEAAISCFQKVILCDRNHSEALSNYALVLLRHGMYDAAIRAYEGAIDLATPDAPGIAHAWGGLAVARAALQQFPAAEHAASHAEQVADPRSRSRFAMLHTSMQARHIHARLRRKAQLSEEVAGPEAGSSEIEKTPSEDSRGAIDAAILRLRALAREIRSSASSTALGAILRMRHEHLWEESGNRNFGAEAAERLVEALEQDQTDASAWVQLALLQMGTGEYTSAREFSMQAVSRDSSIEAAWNSMAVATALHLDDGVEARKAFEKAVQEVRINYCKRKDAVQQTKRVKIGSSSKHDISRKMDEEMDMGENEEQNARSPLLPTLSSSKAELRKLFPTENDGFSDEHDLTDIGKRTMAALYNNIGNVFRQSGAKQFQNALRSFEKSLKLGGEDAVVYNNIALLYISVSKFDIAQDMLEHALKLDPDLPCAISNQLKLRALRRKRERRHRSNRRSVEEAGQLDFGFGQDNLDGGMDAQTDETMNDAIDADEDYLSQGEELGSHGVRRGEESQDSDDRDSNEEDDSDAQAHEIPGYHDLDEGILDEEGPKR